MKIAFYDDDINHKRILEELLYEYSFSRNTDYSIISFSSADDLLNKDLYDMGIHVVNYNKTNKRAFFEKMYFNLNNWFQFI